MNPVIEANGWTDLEEFRDFSFQEIKDWIGAIEKRTVARGGCNFGSVAMNKLQALNYWVDLCIFRGIPLDHNAFDNAIICEAMNDVKIAYAEIQLKVDE
mmetsp:Transcript_13011/g.15874  ORF Transcript_13011/g.15874 Transcript_13011/m.15874 type:complete len:99 (-) Transcript_13011:241-537(-)